MTPDEFRRELIKDLGGFTHDPLGFVLWAFPWGVAGTSLENETGPDEWQRLQLAELGSKLSADPFRLIQEAIASGHGIGKSTQVAWIVLWAVYTFPDFRGVVTANTDTQLRTKTWPEIAKWYSLLRFDALRDMFDMQATSLASKAPGHEKNWRWDAIPWSERNTEAFAGLHNAGRRVAILFDEGSAIIDRIWEVAEGALTDDQTEMLWLVFGNPTRNDGRFRDCFGKYRHLWNCRQIDSRTVKRTNKERLQAIVDAYGEDSDIVKVRVRGMFPSASSMQFISSTLVGAARKREPAILRSEPVIFGVDIARFGDDHSTLAIRQGRDARSRPWKRWYGADTMQVAGDIALEARIWHPDAIMVDVGAMGAGVIDRLRQLLPDILIVEVNFGGKGRNAEWAAGIRVRTANKRSEMWTSMRAWLTYGAIPDEQAIEDDLCGPEYQYNADDAIQLERKRDMKARGMASPDDGDALACTFAEPVEPRELPAHLNPAMYAGSKAADEYSRYED